MLSVQENQRWRLWLITAICMVTLMVLVGGLTRLTESGLSIVEWKVLSGVFPPLNQEAWQQEFHDYQQTPEFNKINSYFGLTEFKRIFWLEYIHRVFGRITGLVFIVPLLYFSVRRLLPTPYLMRMIGLSALVGLQGLFGWIMVKSGLIDDPRVNPLKLSLHLGTAFLLFSLLWWQCLSTKPRAKVSLCQHGRFALYVFTGLLSIQIIFGAWVAGWDAGLIYNTYPLMNGVWIPPGLMELQPWWRNIIEDITMVQFQHRITAKLLAVPLLVLCVIWLRSGQKLPITLLGGAYVLQMALGISTLLYVVPISLASLHQMGALLLLAVTLYICHTSRIDTDQGSVAGKR